MRYSLNLSPRTPPSVTASVTWLVSAKGVGFSQGSKLWFKPHSCPP